MVALTLWAFRQMMNSVGKLDLEMVQNLTVGNDIVFLPDFKSSFNTLFKNKVYTKNEIDYCEQFDEAILRYASTWAAKEAVYKAIKQLNDTPLPFNTIEILRNKIAGKPTVNLLKNTSKPVISLSISHDGDYVWAVAILNQTR